MCNVIERSLVIRKETIYDKIRRSVLVLIYQKDYSMIQRFENLIQFKRPQQTSKIVIPKEIGKKIKNML